MMLDDTTTVEAVTVNWSDSSNMRNCFLISRGEPPKANYDP